MIQLSKTKIIATIGPSSWDENILREMISNGMSIARINASFADFDELKRVSESIRKITARVALMLDTQGHKIRVVGFDKEREIKENDTVIVVAESFSKNKKLSQNHIQISYPSLYKDTTRDAQIVLDDGNIILEVKDIKGEEIFCTVVQGGILKPKKTVNVPGVHLNFPSISKKDEEDIKFAVDNNFDFISASFIRDIDDIAQIRKIMGDTQTRLIAKIENREGVDNFDQILNFVDGIMVARGDMGVELPLWEIPAIQKQMIYKCRCVGKPVIVATQMLESMRENMRPTRAEVSDVANAVMDGCDAVMLSAETSTGKYPALSVKMANDIAFNCEKVLIPQRVNGYTQASIDTDVICSSIFDISSQLNLKGVVVLSKTGKTTQSLSRHRLNIPIWEVGNNVQRIRQNALLRGVKGYYLKDLPSDRDNAVKRAVECVYSYGELDLQDKIAIISGSSITNKSNNTILEISTVKDIIGF
jgi:pyruvate kinase